MPNFARRRYLIDSLQYRIVGIGILHFCVSLLVFAVAVFLPVIIRLNGGTLGSPAVQEAAHEFLTLHNRIWLPLGFALLVMVLHNVLMSHRIAGPLYRFRAVLKTIGYGDLSTVVRLRKRDYLTKEAQVINEMVEALRERVEEVDGHNRATDAALAKLQNALADGSLIDVGRHAAEIEDCLETLNKSLARFDTGRPHRPLRELPAPARTAEHAEADSEPALATAATR